MSRDDGVQGSWSAGLLLSGALRPVLTFSEPWGPHPRNGRRKNQRLWCSQGSGRLGGVDGIGGTYGFNRFRPSDVLLVKDESLRRGDVKKQSSTSWLL